MCIVQPLALSKASSHFVIVLREQVVKQSWSLQSMFGPSLAASRDNLVITWPVEIVSLQRVAWTLRGGVLMLSSQETYLDKLPGFWFLYSPAVTLLDLYTGQVLRWSHTMT